MTNREKIINYLKEKTGMDIVAILEDHMAEDYAKSGTIVISYYAHGIEERKKAWNALLDACCYDSPVQRHGVYKRDIYGNINHFDRHEYLERLVWDKRREAKC